VGRGRVLFTNSELPTNYIGRFRELKGARNTDNLMLYGVLLAGLPTSRSAHFSYPVNEVLFDNYHKMGYFPQKAQPRGLFQWAGLAYFSDLPVSVRATWSGA
jgi:hypothetical protein